MIYNITTCQVDPTFDKNESRKNSGKSDLLNWKSVLWGYFIEMSIIYKWE